VGREKEKFEPQPGVAHSQKSVQSSAVEGGMVRVLSLGVTGRITAIKNEEAEVLVGNIKLRRPISDLEVVENAPMKLPENVRVNISTKHLEKNELNVVGRKVDEAVDLTDKFLDDAFLAQANTIRIVHGMGTGALRQAISELLSHHPHVSHFESAPHAEGGRGVTVVTLRE
jgi:DNA mismatch repair protein MutS2